MSDAVRDHFEEQAGWCRDLGSPFTAGLLLAMQADFDANGPIHALVHDWPGNPRKDALGLRLTGFLHHSVLTGTAGALAREYPAARPDWDMARVWPLARDWLAADLIRVRTFIKSPPQTNETRRAIALLPGFLEIAARFEAPLHLLELGASAGLLQNWDRFHYTTGHWSRPGTSDVTIRTDWHGPAPEHLNAKVAIASRAACDLNPIDVRSPDAVLRLKAYTWPDQAERLARLDAAIALAGQANVQVDAADAQDWLAARLATRPDTGPAVVFHSVFLIYPPREKIAAILDLIAAAGSEATPERPLAWLCYESEALFGGDKASPAMYARLQIWPGGTVRWIARSDGHVTRVDALDPLADRGLR